MIAVHLKNVSETALLSLPVRLQYCYSNTHRKQDDAMTIPQYDDLALIAQEPELPYFERCRFSDRSFQGTATLREAGEHDLLALQHETEVYATRVREAADRQIMAIETELMRRNQTSLFDEAA